jgi:hypothetical protein
MISKLACFVKHRVACNVQTSSKILEGVRKGKPRLYCDEKKIGVQIKVKVFNKFVEGQKNDKRPTP